MATYDISKVDFDPQKHYTSVRMQQGRVLTDDDWNENERIENEDKRRSLIDTVGTFGSPDDGFRIEKTSLSVVGGKIDFQIDKGTLYLGGLRLELDAIEKYRSQKDWLLQVATDNPAPTVADLRALTGQERFDLVYIEAWQQAVSAFEDTALFEPALGGPDTTTRVRNMRQVKIQSNIGFEECSDAWEALKTLWQTGHLGIVNREHERMRDTSLCVSFVPTTPPQDLCTPSVSGGYLGAENQAIRIQLTKNNRFTWGFDNASTLYRAKLEDSGKTVKLLTDPKDQYHWPLSGQVVEILPWSAELPNGEKIAAQSGHLTKVQDSYNPDLEKFTIVNPATAVTGQDFVFVRIWYRGDDLTSVAEISFTVGTSVPLGHTGLAITITGTDFVPEDFWVIAARPETPHQVIPWALTPILGAPLPSSLGMPPLGVRRFFAPLAVIHWTIDNNGQTVKGEIIHDCRKPFLPLTSQHDCCECPLPRVGWQKLFDKYKDGEDICVCFQNGVYELDKTIILRNKGNIKFTGAGQGSKIIVRGTEAAVAFDNCKDILIRDLSVSSNFSGHTNSKAEHDKEDKTFEKYRLNGVVTIQGCDNALLENLTLSCKDKNLEYDKREATCLTVKGGMDDKKNIVKPATITLINSQINIGYMQTGVLIIDATKSHIEANKLKPNLINSKNPDRRFIANQGIVIAGSIIDNVHIKDNVISKVVQGIHVGASNNKQSVKRIYAAGTVIISGNSLECQLMPNYLKEKHGIFVGNCNSLVINENYVKLNIFTGRQILPPMNGIRVYGYFGKRIIVKDNHLEGFGFDIRKEVRSNITSPNYGIFIKYLRNIMTPRWWILEANVTEHIRIEGPYPKIEGNEPLFRTPKMIYADRWRKIKQ
jgi:Family of unknown function (DUF6519)